MGAAMAGSTAVFFATAGSGCGRVFTGSTFFAEKVAVVTLVGTGGIIIGAALLTTGIGALATGRAGGFSSTKAVTMVPAFTPAFSSVSGGLDCSRRPNASWLYSSLYSRRCASEQNSLPAKRLNIGTSLPHWRHRIP